jgi:hypothetical protein
LTKASLSRRQAAFLLLACCWLSGCGETKPSEQDVTDFLKRQVPPYVSLVNVTTQYTLLKTFQGTTMPDNSWQIDITVSTTSSQAFVRTLQAGIFALPGQPPSERGSSTEVRPFMELYAKTIRDGMRHADAFNAAGARSGLDFKPGRKVDNLVGYEAPSVDLPLFVLAVAPAGQVSERHLSLLARPEAGKAGSWHFESLGLAYQQPWDTQTLDEVRQQNPGTKIVAVGSPEFVAMEAKLQALDAQFAN